MREVPQVKSEELKVKRLLERVASFFVNKRYPMRKNGVSDRQILDSGRWSCGCDLSVHLKRSRVMLNINGIQAKLEHNSSMYSALPESSIGFTEFQP